MCKQFVYAILITTVALLVTAARAEDYTITIKDYQFSPRSLVIPAGQKVKLTVVNQNSTPSEFESTDLNREKVVIPGSSIEVYVGPLDPGSYVVFDDFHRETTGTIVAK